ncbi:MAG: histidinol-phosphate transaminase [Balneolaceae bacterium]|nr:histidinol-phosphate transaminase [Balneolaceae bacterium]
MFENRNRPLVPYYIRDLQGYVPGKTIEEVKKAYKPGKISKLASNENRLGCSPQVKEAVLEQFQEIQDYPDAISRKLRGRLAEKHGVKPENIVVAAGSESVISIICRTFFLNDDVAISADATFVGFFVQANVRGIKLKKVPLTDDYRFDLDAMLEAVTDRTKMIYIANPNNPTGTYITDDEFEDFLQRLPSDILVVMDEAYIEYAEGVKDYPDSLTYKEDNVITLRTFSKAYGLAGLRIGYGVAHEDLISHMQKTKLTFEPTAMAQEGAMAALDDQAFLERSRQMVSEGRERLYRFFEKQGIKYVPSISNAVLMVLPTEEEARQFTQSMMEEGVILRRVGGFGLPNCIRITIGTEEEMDHFEESFDKVFVS